MISQRDNFLTWDEYFMTIALQAAQRSKDPSTQVGACIIDTDKRIIGTGYNGFIQGIDETQLTWEREGEHYETKYPHILHAEMNAIHSADRQSLKGATIYSTLHPCGECAPHIAQVGIKEIVYLDHKYQGTPGYKHAERTFKIAGINTRQFLPDLEKIKKTYEKILKDIEMIKKLEDL